MNDQHIWLSFYPVRDPTGDLVAYYVIDPKCDGLSLTDALHYLEKHFGEDYEDEMDPVSQPEAETVIEISQVPVHIITPEDKAAARRSYEQHRRRTNFDDFWESQAN